MDKRTGPAPVTERPDGTQVLERQDAIAPPSGPPHTDPAAHPGMVWISGGSFLMGSDRHYQEEAPARRVTVRGFFIDRQAVTNTEFARFVDATGYSTLAERAPDPACHPGAQSELLVPASVVFQKPRQRVDLRSAYNWWSYVPGANWRHPQGPNTSIEGLDAHPVVHIAYEDADAFARWAGKDLPAEAEWEFAARGGLEATEYAWGGEFSPGGRMMANTWQGEFPLQNLLTDGYEWTAPVGSYPPNGYGLVDMIGNVWEWTSDLYHEHGKSTGSCCDDLNPRSGVREESPDAQLPEIRIPRKIIKGGSFLCAPNYCRRYRPAARVSQPIDTSTCHLGFRCIVRPAHSAG